MKKTEMMAMLLAGGQGSRLGVLTKEIAKPAVMFGGKYRIVDFPLSNCTNSGIYTVGVLTQYEPLVLTKHISIGIPWDLDRTNEGVTVLSPFVKETTGNWYSGTANAIYQNIKFIDNYNPEYVLILSGDHVYKMDYSKMLDYHKEKNADATIAVLEVDLEEAKQFGIMTANEEGKIVEFAEKPQEPKSNLASMGIYIFTWKKLRQALIDDDELHEDSDFGKHIIPKFINDQSDVYAYHFNSYWKDIGTIEAYWEANMELTHTLPAFNLYDEFWKIYTNIDHQPPQFIYSGAVVEKSLISEGCEIRGKVYNSVLGPRVVVEENAIVSNSIVMQDTVIRKDAMIERTIVSEKCDIGKGCCIGQGENIVHHTKPHIYYSGITAVGAFTTIPDHVMIGKNCEVNGDTKPEDYKNRRLESGTSLIR